MPENNRVKPLEIELHTHLGTQLGTQNLQKKGGFFGVYYQKTGQKWAKTHYFWGYITHNNNVT
jgi:hypothetical protein